MKVYAAPEGINVPTPDYSKPYDRAAEEKRENEYLAALKAWLLDNGFTGPYTGEIANFPMGDGYARYMLGDKPRGGVLVHLEMGDAWDDPNVAYLPKKVIVENIERGKRLREFFGRK